MLRKHRRLSSSLLIGCLIVLGTLTSLGLQGGSSTVDARVLLNEATDPVSALLNADQASHTTTIVFQRPNPHAVEPPDPYHKRVLDLYSDTFVEERWSRGGDTRQWRVTTRDTRSGLLLYDTVRDGDRYSHYSSASDYAYTLTDSVEPRSGEALTVTEVAQQDGLEVVGTTVSSWGKPAWIVRARREAPPSDALANNLNGPAHLQRPYLNDLHLEGIEQTWLIDQETRELVRYEQSALTPTGVVVVERRESTRPVIRALSTLPADWLVFPRAEVKVPVQDGQDDNGPANALATRLLSLDEAIVAAPFTPHLPDAARFNLRLTSSSYRSPVVPKEVWEKTWSFDIQAADGFGLGLQTIYSPGAPGTTSQAFVIMQGSAKLLVPYMQDTTAFWTESHPVQLSVDGQEVTAWVATGGNIDNPPRRVVVMLELDGTFLFVVGQSYTEEQVLAILRTLRSAR